jgi:acetyl-CoA carboxylase alpha subunit
MSERLTFDMEGFKLLEDKISKLVDTARKLKEENLILIKEIESLRNEKERLEKIISEFQEKEKLLNSYKEERNMIRNIIERIINKIAEVGI